MSRIEERLNGLSDAERQLLEEKFPGRVKECLERESEIVRNLEESLRACRRHYAKHRGNYCEFG